MKELINSLECCNAATYQGQEQFKFLPAHRRLLMNIPSKIEVIKGAEKGKHKSVKIGPTNSNEHLEENSENLDAVQSVEEITCKLLNKLRSFGEENLFREVAKMSEEYINNMEINFGKKTVGTCQIKCPICSHIRLCRYNGAWATSNIYKHFRTHKDWISLDSTGIEETLAENDSQTISLSIQSVSHQLDIAERSTPKSHSR